MATAAAVDCASGDVCFWSGANFTGHKCSWDAADPDWQGGSTRCSWAATTNVKSGVERRHQLVHRRRLLPGRRLQRPYRLHPAAARRQPGRHLQAPLPQVDQRQLRLSPGARPRARG
ncbi:peptidase inhibitor family I36 protein, partial [Streptomyces turgidiscabies]|uniref:peptidase inhibitor family I36 protein n=1 Tax=Streptomyces turgidiscabies TaxID=85558 RepID=UPI0030CA2BC7